MNISATYNGEMVNIVDIDVNGHNIYVTYVDSMSNLKSSITYFGGSPTIIATSATIIV